jgi:uncharacterized membrane protein
MLLAAPVLALSMPAVVVVILLRIRHHLVQRWLCVVLGPVSATITSRRLAAITIVGESLRSTNRDGPA